MNALRFDIRIDAGNRTLVDVENFQIPLNRITVLFGESGIGKTMIAKAIYGLLDPEDFQVSVNGQSYNRYLQIPETQETLQNSFFVFQEPSSHLNPLLPLKAQLREGSLAQAPDDARILRDMWEGSDEEEIRKLLEVYPKPYRPSGGEKQRMFLVMALKKIDMGRHGSKLFVFDEPTGSLDNYYRDIFLSLLFKRFQAKNLTALLITHDYSMVGVLTRTYRSVIDRVSFKELTLRNGRLTLKEFEPELYLRWLDRQRPERVAPSGRGAPLLRVESGVEVFGQRLTISKEPRGVEVPLEVFRGEVTYLKGPSGTGKTTLVKLVMGLIRGQKLRVTLNGTVMTGRTPRRFWHKQIWGKRMAMVFQHADEALNPYSTVRGTFRGLPSRRPITTEDIRQTLRELFEDEMRDNFLNKQVRALSGGQKQRLNLLRSLFLDTEILILDEPLNGLDFESTIKVLALLKEKRRVGKGILLISHNEEIFDALIPEENVYFLHSQPNKHWSSRTQRFPS